MRSQNNMQIMSRQSAIQIRRQQKECNSPIPNLKITLIDTEKHYLASIRILHFDTANAF